ncbi:MAG TPA: HAD family hydrolase [Firmicutes bacterium]|nr:HAD family hydrolase [Bacillota bacterium]
MIKAILFDLDGTLLNYDPDVFLGQYLKALAAKVSGIVAPDRFIRQLIASTEAMVRNTDASRTNREVFMEDFFPKIGIEPARLMPVFDEFYANEFRSLKAFVKAVPEARSIIETTLRSGIDVVIATNPVFPEVAIRERLRWAGIDDFPYKLVTSYEIMHFCKPNEAYYEEILDIIDRRPEECLMVGNDVDEDLPAANLGIRTFLVKDCLIIRNNNAGTAGTGRASFVGSFSDLADFIAGGFLARL